MNSLIIEEGLLLLLQQSMAITSICTIQGIFLNIVPQGSLDPTCCFSKISSSSVSSNDGPSGLTFRRYQFETFSKNYVSAIQLQEAIRQTLDGFTGILPNGQRVYNIMRDNELDGFDDVTLQHRTIADYFVHYQD